MKNTIQEIIKRLDEKTLLQIHKNLTAAKEYDSLLDITELDDDIEKIRKAVGLRLSNPGKDTLNCVPEPVRNVLNTVMHDTETVRSSAGQSKIFAEQQTPNTANGNEHEENLKNRFQTAPEYEPITAERESGAAEALITELTELAGERDAKNQLTEAVRNRFCVVLEELISKHSLSFTLLEGRVGMSRQALAKYLKNFRKEHVKESLKLGKQLVQPKKAIKKTIEDDLSERASEMTSRYLNLGESIFQKYELEAMQRGFRITILADRAIESYLRYGDLYSGLIKADAENEELRLYINELEAALIYIHNRNKKLERVIYAK